MYGRNSWWIFYLLNLGLICGTFRIQCLLVRLEMSLTPFTPEVVSGGFPHPQLVYFTTIPIGLRSD